MLRLLRNPRVWFAVIVVGGLLAVALWPRAVPVQVQPIARGPLVVTVDEEGETRVRDRFVVSAPVSGRVLRIELEPGDTVKKGAVVARIQPEAAPLLDARTRAELAQALESARAAVGRTKADEQQARTQLARSTRDLERQQQLMRDGLTTGQQLETQEAEVRALQQAVEAATFAVQAAESEVRRAQVRLAPPPAEAGAGRVVTVTAPVDGIVLKRVRESESVVPAGDALVEIGDPQRLEIVADLLSTDAVKVKAGQRAIVDQWGGDRPLDARVRRVEPSGFTKVSALGVEEQRVNVVLDFGGDAGSAAALAALGDAYRVEVRIVLWEAADVLKVPTSALFRQGDDWAVYVVQDGRARVRPVRLGQRTGQEAELLDGLALGEGVVLHPGDTLTEGTRVSVPAAVPAR